MFPPSSRAQPATESPSSRLNRGSNRRETAGWRGAERRHGWESRMRLRT
jgi:hypothetical protein